MKHAWMLHVPAIVFAGTLGSAQANSFRLESNTIVFDEAAGRATLNVKNESTEPLLLVSELKDLPGDNLAARFLVSPPVTRIDPGNTQLIRFRLKKGQALDREWLLKASFEGVPPRKTGGTRIAVRQEIGFIVQPKRLRPNAQPWRALYWRREGADLVLHNPGEHVVRLAPQMTLLPSGKTVTLGQLYVRAGETVRSPLPEDAGDVTTLRITPFSRQAYALPVFDIADSRLPGLP
ncbi:MAG TPA: fimbria/pilus chaperone family protein [Dyella sp.]|uniref:fimbria/pilus chaperone family protein n=1 Tax=Dyella sp. TaxID=1869338 RepID=UPI002F91E984